MKKKDADIAYEQGKPILSDEEYDKKYGANASALVLPKNTPWKKFTHTNPMASLSKVDVIDANNDVYWDSFIKWFTHPVLLSKKLDGIAIKLYYKDGVLTNAVTRGNGKEGEDVLRNIVKASNVKKKIKNKFVREIIGEVIFPLNTFKELLQDEYSAARNGAVGALKDFKGRNAKHLKVVYHDILVDDAAVSSEFKKMKLIKKLGLDPIPYKLCKTVEEVKEYYLSILEKRENLDYEIDGMVAKINRESTQDKFGYSANGNPNFAAALKFPFIRKITKLKNIEWSRGLSGTLNPVAIVKPIDLGVTVQRISLANLDLIDELWGKRGPKKGDHVLISRRGDVIPYLEKVVKKVKGKKLSPPEICNICQKPTLRNGPFLECSNADCDSRKLGDLHKWINKIKAHFRCKGLGGERIIEMFDKSLVKNPAHFYMLTPEILIKNLTGVKEAAAKNILSFQEHRVIPLDLFIGALNIPNIGQSIIGFLIDAGYDTLEKIQKMSKHELATIDNLGEIRAQLILIWLKKKDKLIQELLKVVSIASPEPKKENKSNKLDGASFCFTGALSKSRPHFETIVKENGGCVKGMSKSLNFLVVGDNAGSKLDKAKSFGITILSEKGFLDLIQRR